MVNVKNPERGFLFKQGKGRREVSGVSRAGCGGGGATKEQRQGKSRK